MCSHLGKSLLVMAMLIPSLLSGTSPAGAENLLADTVYYNGIIYTMTETPQEAQKTENAHKADVVAARDGRIVFVGSREDAQKAGYFTPGRVGRCVDLRGKAMYPGFVDGHGHFPRQGTYDLYQVNLSSPLLGGTVDTMDKLVAKLAQKARTVPEGMPIIGWRYDDTQIAEQRHPNRHDLDRASTRHPIMIMHISGHITAVNSATIEKYKISDSNDTPGLEKDASGKITGVLFELKARSLMPLLDELKTNAGFGTARACQVYAAAGVTTADLGGAIVRQQLPQLQNALSRDQLDLRVLVHPYGYRIAKGSTGDAHGLPNRKALGWKDRGDGKYTDASQAPTVGQDITRWQIPGGEAVPADLPADYLLLGAHKFVYDGSPQGYTAWMKAPGYYDWRNYTPKDSFMASEYFVGLPGTVNIPYEALLEGIKIYHAAGQGVEIHTNGPAAAEAFIAAIEEAVATYPHIRDTRHTSIHAQTMERQHIERMTGNYADLERTAGMYSGLRGAFAHGKVDLTMGGRLPQGNLPELMKAQHLFNSYFNNHTYFYGYRHTNQFFGPGRAFNMSPTGWSEYYGQPYSFHNDTTITPISPLRSIQSAVTRISGDARADVGQKNLLVNGTGKDINATAEYKARINATETSTFWTYDHRLNALQALRAVTVAPAYQNKVEDRIGSLREGMFADFVIMDEDILDVAVSDPMRIARMRVAATIVGDRLVYGMLPDDASFVAPVNISYTQPRFDTTAAMDRVQAVPVSSVAAGEAGLGAYAFTASVPQGESTIFRMDFLGNGESLEKFALHGMADGGMVTYAYKEPSADGMTQASGQWWVATLDDPTIALPRNSVLDMDRTYIAFFIIRDNDGTLDADARAGTMAHRVMMTTAGSLPANGLKTR